MARKHNKKFKRKAAVEQVQVGTTERKIVTAADGTFTVIPGHTVTKQGKALDSTTTKGQRNVVPEKGREMKLPRWLRWLFNIQPKPRRTIEPWSPRYMGTTMRPFQPRRLS